MEDLLLGWPSRAEPELPQLGEDDRQRVGIVSIKTFRIFVKEKITLGPSDDG
jgi:hypothetical protein